MRTFHYLVATVFGLGYSPLAPGTLGAIAAVLLAAFILQGQLLWLSLAVILVTLVGTVSADFLEKDLGEEDPSLVIIDEVAGMLLGLLFVPLKPWPYLIALGLFRFFDIVKPFPVNTLEKVPGGWGIMLDDIAAGIYTLIGMQLMLALVNF